MKIWNAFSSEHSMNLVMIGKFKEVRHAQEAAQLIARLTEQVVAEPEAYEPGTDTHRKRFSDAMLRLLEESRIYSLYPSELGQFELDVRVEQRLNQITITTDEVDISAFLKLLIDKGARVEVYSAHDHPDIDEDDSDQAE